ncbi:hypothetical protein ERN12_02560 [Rhodobacteraceae bacterium]|nr:hypothetical protein ERN12_02560 [Paracoccaceae bacterium]
MRAGKIAVISPVPNARAPLYQATKKVASIVEELRWEAFRDKLNEQAGQGVDCLAIRAGRASGYCAFSPRSRLRFPM